MTDQRTPPDNVELDVRGELLLGALRIAGGLAGVAVVLANVEDHSEVLWRGQLVLWGLLALVGAATIAVTARRQPGPWIARLRLLTLAVDAIVLLAQAPLHLDAGGHLQPSPALLVPLLASLKYAWRGLAAGLAGLVVAEAAWAHQAVTLVDVGIDTALADVGLNVVVAATVGALVAHAARQLRTVTRVAIDATDRAAFAEMRAADAQAEATAMNAVLAAAAGLATGNAANEIVGAMSRALRANVELTLTGAGDGLGPVIVSSHTGTLAAAVAKTPVTVPVRFGDQALGELSVSSGGVGPDPVMVEQLADHVAIALVAAATPARGVAAEEAGTPRAVERRVPSPPAEELRRPVETIAAAADTLFEQHEEIPDDLRLALAATVLRNAERLRRIIDEDDEPASQPRSRPTSNGNGATAS